jgi:hypothetical protein
VSEPEALESEDVRWWALTSTAEDFEDFDLIGMNSFLAKKCAATGRYWLVLRASTSIADRCQKNYQTALLVNTCGNTCKH